jgi:hypothetical protein
MGRKTPYKGTRRRRKGSRRQRRQKGGNTLSGVKQGIFIMWPMGGGFGNQLYVYAAALVLKRKFNIPIYALPDTNTRETTDYYKTLFKECIAIEMSPEVEARINAAENPFKDTDLFTKWSVPPATDKDIVIRDKYLQNHSCIVPVISDIRAPIMDILSKKYTDVKVDSDSSCFLHVRRGDYVDMPNAVLPTSYYQAALDKIKDIDAIKTVYIVCEPSGKQWCIGQGFKTEKKIEWVDTPDELRAFYTMSLCRGGAVLSRSTFSVWAAEFGADENAKSAIFIPSIWMTSKSSKDCMFPERWEMIEIVS